MFRRINEQIGRQLREGKIKIFLKYSEFVPRRMRKRYVRQEPQENCIISVRFRAVACGSWQLISGFS